MEQHREGREQRHEERGPLLAGERLHALAELAREDDRPTRSRVGLHAGARAIGRKVECTWGTFECRSRVGERALEGLAGEPGSLPGGVVGVLDQERREAMRPPLVMRLVEFT